MSIDVKLKRREPVAMAKINGCRLSENGMGLEFDDDLPIESWMQIGPQLENMKEASKMCIGDWINLGEGKYGEKYSQALWGDEKTRFALEHYSYVARHVAICTRRTDLSFNHHLMVAKLPPEQQGFWLDSAKKAKLTSRDLRESIKAGKITRVVDIPSDRNPSVKGLTTLEGVMMFFKKWVKEAEEKQPVVEWSEERRELVKEELTFVVEFWKKL